MNMFTNYTSYGLDNNLNFGNKNKTQLSTTEEVLHYAKRYYTLKYARKLKRRREPDVFLQLTRQMPSCGRSTLLAINAYTLIKRISSLEKK